jgi:hypothetical protein
VLRISRGAGGTSRALACGGTSRSLCMFWEREKHARNPRPSLEETVHRSVQDRRSILCSKRWYLRHFQCR